MKKMKQLLKEENGSMLETLASFLVVCFLILLIVNVSSALTFRSRVGTFTDNVVKIISIEGKYDNDVKEKIREYQEESGLQDAEISLDGTDFLAGTQKIQLSDQINVVVSSEYDLDIFTFGSFPIHFTNKATARSEVYWR